MTWQWVEARDIRVGNTYHHPGIGEVYEVRDFQNINNTVTINNNSSASLTVAPDFKIEVYR